MGNLEGIQEMLTSIKMTECHSLETSCDDSKNPSAAENLLQQVCDRDNRAKGDLKGYDCPICKNRGHVAFVKDGYVINQECQCMDFRRNIIRIEKSGLKNLLIRYTFKNYVTSEKWQENIYEQAKRFIDDHDEKWFYIGGQPGTGKTHICTAVVSEFMKSGYSARYMLWLDEVISLKELRTHKNDYRNDIYDKTEKDYQAAISEFKTVPILYIDDFLKTVGDSVPTDADLRIALEILNYRYNDNRLITLISTEKLVNEIIGLDEALGGRIYQRTKDYCIQFKKEWGKDYRLKAGTNNG